PGGWVVVMSGWILDSEFWFLISLVVFVVGVSAPVTAAVEAPPEDVGEVERPEAEDHGRQPLDETEEVADEDAEPVAGAGELFEHLRHRGQQERSRSGEHNGEEQVQPQPGAEPSAGAEPVLQPR